MTAKELKANSSFPEGWDSSGEIYLSQAALSEYLKGKQIKKIEFTSYHTVVFILEGGMSVSLTPSGLEGEDIDLLITSGSEGMT